MRLKHVGIVAAFSALIGAGVHWWFDKQAATRPTEVGAPIEIEPIYPHLIPPKSTLAATLKDLEVNARTVHEIVAGAKPVMDLGRVSAGTRFRLARLTADPASDLVEIEFQLSPIETVSVKKVNGAWTAQRRIATVESRVVTFTGQVRTTLWASAEGARMDPNLIVQLAEIFAWQVDFAREVRLADRWRLSIEQKFVRGKPAGWGSIVAAEYLNADRTFRAVLFETSPGKWGYFAPDGSSLKRMFLKSPIKYGRITSRFNRKRFHPVLKFTRPHLGTDYGAPTGTPIHAVGDGVIAFAARSGGGGNTIKLRHNSIYQTNYLHLSRFEKGIRAGTRVQQGQVIGYVGATGLATGPHLHFEFIKGGVVLDPLGETFPTAEPVPPQRMADFKVKADELIGALPDWRKIATSSPEPEPERSQGGKIAR